MLDTWFAQLHKVSGKVIYEDRSGMQKIGIVYK